MPFLTFSRLFSFIWSYLLCKLESFLGFVTKCSLLEMDFPESLTLNMRLLPTEGISKNYKERKIACTVKLPALYACTNGDTYDFQSTLWWSSRVLSIFRSVWLKRSTISFPIGWYGVVLVFSTPAKKQSSLITLLSKFLPWSLWRRAGKPLCKMIFSKSNLAVVLAFWSLVGNACA